MTAENFLAYAVQLAALVASAWLMLSLTRLRAPRPALACWHAVFLASIVLPFTQGHGIEESSTVAFGSTHLIGAALAGPPTWLGVGSVTLVITLLLGISALRLGWLIVGLVRLRGLRRRSEPLPLLPDWVTVLSARVGAPAPIRISDEIDSPVTIGAWRPVILLPRRALTLPRAVQEGIICHELLHIRRWDWTSTVVEQAWLALLWFHPAAHVVASRLQLLREAVVDRETIALTGDRRAYARALLTFAEPAVGHPVAVSSLIRPRHLGERITLLTQEVSMSRSRIAVALIAAITSVSTVTAMAVSRFPMTPSSLTSTQTPVRPGNGVTVPRVTKEVKPEYTAAALQAGIQGDVEIDVVVQADGKPGDVSISRSLDTVHGLDEAALRAAAEWKFEPGRKNGEPVPVLITLLMTFRLK